MSTPDAEDISRILVEIETGKTPAVPDTPELAALRAQLTSEVEEIHAQGMAVEVHHDIPGFDE